MAAELYLHHGPDPQAAVNCGNPKPEWFNTLNMSITVKLDAGWQIRWKYTPSVSSSPTLMQCQVASLSLTITYL